jgi:hypothetical protein
VLAQVRDHAQQLLKERDFWTTPGCSDSPIQEVSLVDRRDAAHGQIPVSCQQFQCLLASP